MMHSLDGLLIRGESPVTDLAPGQRVAVLSHGNVMDWPFRTAAGVLRGFTVPHGFAVVDVDDWGEVPPHIRHAPLLIHPESLEAR